VSGLLGAFFIQLGVITYRDVTQGGDKTGPGGTAPINAPLPSQYLSAILIYGVLGVMPASTAPLPGLIGWGLVVATMLNLWTPGSANAANAANAKLGSALTTAPPQTQVSTAPKS